MAPLHLQHFLTTRSTRCVGLLGAAVLMACAGGAVQTDPQPAAATPGDEQAASARQAERIRDLQERVAELQLGLLDKEAQVAELRENLDEAVLEVVRAKARLQSVDSRAEAASTMAEAEIALNGVRDAAGGDTGPELLQAEQLLEMSARAFEGENYGGALYLASQAMGLASIGRGRFSAGDVSRRAGEISFAVPLRLETVRNSNVRDGPGRGSKVLFTVRERTPLVGLAYVGQWVRIRDDQGRGGWVFHSLVRSRPRNP